jgi:hypothetical protein
MSNNNPATQLNDLLITKNFDIKALDAATGKPPMNDQGVFDIADADMFSFDYQASSGKNYGSVVIVLGNDNEMTVFFGDNVGKGMESEDKTDWYNFLSQLRQFAKRNMLRFDLQNLNRLKYTMQGISAIKEGLFEGYYGTRRVSYAGEPTEARLMIRHNRNLGESDARFRYVESIYIETADQERFKLPFKNLAGGRAMLEHVRQGGRPYDIRGNHIAELVEQISVLSQFRRAHQGRVFEGSAADLITETNQYYQQLRSSVKHMSSGTGYQRYFESWQPADCNDQELMVEDIKNLFVETRIDPRIEQALTVLAHIKKGTDMKEADIFESWVNNMIEGTWALPDTPEQKERLKELLSSELIVGPDATNAVEQLYDLVGDDQLFDQLADLASKNPDADARDIIVARLQELGVNVPQNDTDGDSTDQLDEVLPALAGVVGRGLASAAIGSALTGSDDEPEEVAEKQGNADLKRLQQLTKFK